MSMHKYYGVVVVYAGSIVLRCPYIRGPYGVRATPLGWPCVRLKDITVPVQISINENTFIYHIRVPCGRRKNAIRCTYIRGPLWAPANTAWRVTFKVFSNDHT